LIVSIHSKSTPNHAAKLQKTVHFLAFEKIFGNPNYALKFTAKQCPAMQPSVRKFHYAGTCANIDAL